VDGTIREQADGRLGPARAGGGKRRPTRRDAPAFVPTDDPTVLPPARLTVRPSCKEVSRRWHDRRLEIQQKVMR